MTQKEIREIIVARFKSHYKANVSSKGVKNLTEVVKSIQALECSKKEITSYVDFCMNEFKKSTSEQQKLGSVNYFAAIVANKNSLKKYTNQLLKNGGEEIKRTREMDVIMEQLSHLFRATTSHSDLQRISKAANILHDLGYSKKDVAYYIDYCIKIFKKIVKNPNQRGDVSNFTRFFTSQKMIDRHQDYLNTLDEIKEESPIEQEDDDEPTMRVGGHIYHRLRTDDDRDIFFCPITIKFLIKDYSEMVPKIYRLSTYNAMYPERKITMDTVEKLIRGGKLCHT